MPIWYEMCVRGNVFSFCERRTLEIDLSSVRHKSSQNLKPTTIQKMKASATYLSVLLPMRRNYEKFHHFHHQIHHWSRHHIRSQSNSRYHHQERIIMIFIIFIIIQQLECQNPCWFCSVRHKRAKWLYLKSEKSYLRSSDVKMTSTLRAFQISSWVTRPERPSTKSSRPEGPKAGPKGRYLEVVATMAPRHVVN